jgi:hypothetical protein
MSDRLFEGAEYHESGANYLKRLEALALPSRSGSFERSTMAA